MAKLNSAAFTAVYSVTWSFKNMLICYSRNISILLLSMLSCAA